LLLSLAFCLCRDPVPDASGKPTLATFAWLQFSFAVMTGPLMWSIVAMRNSLVFHDGDKITTLMMHASPAITAWWVDSQMDGQGLGGWRAGGWAGRRSPPS